MGFKVWKQDVGQAYIQSHYLTRNVYIRPDPTFGLKSTKLITLQKPLYGLPHGGDYWSEEFTSHVKVTGDLDLAMEETMGD